MNLKEALDFSARDEWRAWLEKNYDTMAEVWLVYYKKASGRPRIPYDDAVEEAVCFGWIDSTVRRIDDECYAQRFTPRKDKSRWSETNIGRAEKMIREGKMAVPGLEKYRNGMRYVDHAPETEESGRTAIPPDLASALGQYDGAYTNFTAFAPYYRKLSIRWINDAKRDATRKKRIAEIALLASENKKKEWI